MPKNILRSKIMLFSFLIVILAVVLFLYLPYSRDIKKAYAKLHSLERQVVETDCGPMEAAVRGEGVPVLVSHGIGGGFDQGLGLVQAYLGQGYRIIAPSRFGYLGTPMPTNATPRSQADAYVCILDSLGIDRAIILANSAGGTSSFQMALHHPERVQALVLIATAAPSVGEYITLPPKPVIERVFSSDFLLWVITTHFQTMMKPAVGVPDGYPRTVAEQSLVSDVIRSVLPIKPRTKGFVFDMFTSNLDMDKHPDQYPMEEISVPTLIIHAVDDPLAKYENAEALAARIPNAELVSIPSGGHLFLGMEETVRLEITQFLDASNRKIDDVIGKLRNIRER